MKNLLFSVAIVVLLCGCQKPALSSSGKWEYKTVDVENANHTMRNSYSCEIASNPKAGEMIRYLDANIGDFHFDSTLDDLGRDGWELACAVPLSETVPGAEFISGDHYNPSNGQITPVSGKFTNQRTGKVILIFKRPK